jgi:hypothetical protein
METRMKHIPALFAAVAISFAGVGAANAATTKPVERTAKSIECSKQADAKGLHGKERQKFRSECKRGKS